jgi:putative ATPase
VDIFEDIANREMAASAPLAERIRPTRITEVIGQDLAVGQGTLIRHALETDRIFSMILWGPPGCGKTTLARIIATETASRFVAFSAVLSGVKEVRAVVEEAKRNRQLDRRRTILFVDEIHRFNKAQQDAFLPHVESGLITLIGATTENPSFEIIPALLSRCRVITLNSLEPEHLVTVLSRAMTDTEKGLGKSGLTLTPEAAEHLAQMADGDARSALSFLEIAADLASASGSAITPELVNRALQQQSLRYDKDGEEHYNLISALHKSLRGSDPDAALYWLARMLAAGEDPMYIARRMVRFASEDVGNADPFALTLTMSATETFRFLGRPEGELALAQAAVYLATAPKSNSLYVGYGNALRTAKSEGALPVPFHIRNAPTGLMKSLGYGKGYQYAHDFPEGYSPQEYLPDKLRGTVFYHPTERGHEKAIKARLDKWRTLKKGIRKETDPSDE